MMKMSTRVTSSCLVLLLALTSVSAVQKRLDSINDLKEINFGQSVPKHSLLLLYWFANAVDLDHNGIRLTFDPNRGDYDSHHYGNYEQMLDPLPRGRVYYTIGNLYQDSSMSSMQLPSYVVRPPSGYEGVNTDRIIIRVWMQNQEGRFSQRIDQVYITQHHHHQGTYDPDQTYQITPNLLRQLREFSTGENQQRLSELRNRFGRNADDSQLWRIRNTWGNLAGLGLLLYIVMQKTSSYSFNEQSRRQNNWDGDTFCNNGDGDTFCLTLLILLILLIAIAFIIIGKDLK